jgi:hypothetical protein
MTSHGPADPGTATLRRAAPNPIVQAPSTTNQVEAVGRVAGRVERLEPAAGGIRLRLGPCHQGEPRFAPRPIEAAQPEPVRGDWAAHRANTWHKLARPGRFVHYIELRKLLIEHGDRLANDIDNSSANYRSNSAN